MSPTKKRTKALAGGVAGSSLLLAVAVAAVAHGADTGPATSAASILRNVSAGTGGTAAPSPDSGSPAEAPPDTAQPATDAPPAPAAKAAVPPTTATTRRTPVPPTTAAPAAVAAAPAPAPAPAPAKPAPGQRVPFTTAGVQAAIAALHQRIPLFSPTDPQLRTFADAVCTSFDQGQTMTQVQGTVRQAVSHIQGASLSPADADFAVRTVAQLRCPGYLP